jgi:uncharacterized membrane protein YsdA (DUF1294 family)
LVIPGTLQKNSNSSEVLLPPSLLFTFYLIINTATLILYGKDKVSAQTRRRRTRETTLLSISLLGGAFGGLLAMFFFRHKTLKPIFWIANTAGAILHLLLIAWLTA